MCNKAIGTYRSVMRFVPDWYITPEMWDRVVSKEPLMLKYCHDRYETQDMWDRVVDSYLLGLKFVPDWFVMSKMIKTLMLLYF